MTQRADYKVDYEEWFKQLDNYERNKKGMSIKTHISFVDDEIVVDFVQVDDQYEQHKEKVKKLILCIAKGAVISVYDFANPKYVPDDEYDDYIKEYEKNIKLANQNMEEYLNILFNEGFESFLSVSSIQFHLKELSYNLDHIYYNNGWKLTGGRIWKKGLWELNNEGYWDYTVHVFNNIIGYGK